MDNPAKKMATQRKQDKQTHITSGGKNEMTIL